MSRPFLLFTVVLLAAAALPGQDKPFPNPSHSVHGQLAFIEGAVSFPNGHPAPFVYLRVERQGIGGMVESATTDSSGYYSFAGKFLGGGFVILAAVQGFQPIRRPVLVTSLVTEVDFVLQRAASVAEPGRGAVVSVDSLRVPSGASAQYEQGLRHMAEGKFSVAEASFRRAIRLYPDYAASFRQLAAVYAMQGRFLAAHQAIQRGIEIEPGSAENYAYLGYVCLMEKQAGKAEVAFRKSLAISKGNWFANLELGRLRYDENRFADAYPFLERAHERHPQVRSVHLLLYDDLIRLNKLEKALVELDDILARYPGFPEAPKLRKVRPMLETSITKRQQ
jgi:tetratricopeptide (TPR) repeat protein